MKAQVTLFVIIGILIIASAGLVFFISKEGAINKEIMPVESKILECIESTANEGADILGEQGGYIQLPKFEAGNAYIPFANQFNFFGSKLPYWVYTSSNGLIKEQVPTTSLMETQLADYINERINECDLSEFENNNYIIEKEESAKSKAVIREKEIYVEIEWPVTVTFGNAKQRVVTHKTSVKNNLGGLYSTAKLIFEKEKKGLIFENYTIDVLTLYAPGTNVELSCAPKIWSKQKVISDLKEALKVNLQSVKFSGDYFSLNKEENKYFVTNLGKKVSGNINVVYDTNFPTQIEIEPSSNDLLRADPVGIQEGLGMLGLCYVPYHFVYSMEYPLVVQVFDENYKMFQFSVTVSIKNNMPRGQSAEEQPPEIENTFCEYKTTPVQLSIIDRNGRPVNANISYKCHTSLCRIGESENGRLEENFPQCINGFIVAESNGYAASTLQLSTNEEASAVVIMPKKYNLNVEALVSDKLLDKEDNALISFTSPDYSASAYLPEQNEISLPEGVYNITAFVFKKTNITLEKESSNICVKVPKAGVLGALGFEEEECYDVEMPKQELSQVAFGGGETILDITEEELSASSKIEVGITGNPIPKTLDELQTNYNLIAQGKITAQLK